MSSSPWVVCFISIRFDLDIGPVVEHVTPPGSLSDEGERLLTQVAFPDCNPNTGHDLIFFFSMKGCTVVAQQNQDEAPGASCTGCNGSSFYGATYYRQKRDDTVPRGYVQQAVVLLSRLPYMAVHELILRVVVPRLCQCCLLSPDTEKIPVLSAASPMPSTFFEVDSSFNPSQYSQREVLERAMEEIEGWPSPHPHVQYNLMLLCQPFTFVTPTRSLQSSSCRKNTERRCVVRLDDRVEFLSNRDPSVGVYDMIPLYTLLNKHLRHMTRIWELLLCHEPLFIWSNTPSLASAVAFAVTSLVRPIEFNGVLYSYLTVQDEQFGHFSRMGKAIPFPKIESIIVGATNPFFFRAFDGWKNRLTVVDRQTGNVTGLEPMDEKDLQGENCSPVNTSPLSSTSGASSPVCRFPSGGMGQSPHQRVFTYHNFYPALTAAREKTKKGHESSLEPVGVYASLPHQQSTGMFRSPFQFVVDHKGLTAILLERLEQASRLNAEAQLVSLNAHTWNSFRKPNGNGMEKAGISGDRGDASRSVRPFSQCSIADDILRKFFDTLTKEFLMPVSAWFQWKTRTLTVFHLCDPATLTALAPESFLHFLDENRESIPSFLSHQPYKVCGVMYERFTRGSLFQSVLWQLVDKKVRQDLKDVQVDDWAAQHPSEVERIEMFINLHKLVWREAVQSVDPDVVFITMATSVLAEMTTHISDPLREQLLCRVRELKL